MASVKDLNTVAFTLQITFQGVDNIFAIVWVKKEDSLRSVWVTLHKWEWVLFLFGIGRILGEDAEVHLRRTKDVKGWIVQCLELYLHFKYKVWNDNHGWD